MLIGTESARTGNDEHMSDTSQGPGWWLASDGKWYPPETWTGPPRPDAAPASGAAYPNQPSMPAYSPAYITYQSGSSGGPRHTNGLAIASLVCACAGIIPFFFGITCVLGIVFGFVSRNQIKQSGGVQQGSGLALAGIIVGFSLIGIFVIVISIVAATGGFHACTGTNNFNCSNS
jgi:hypothetical protein